MTKDMVYENCPLRLVAAQNPNNLNRNLDLFALDESVRKYQASPECNRYELRSEIFFMLTPFLLKSLSWYCHATSGCGVSCKVGDLLSAAYLEFSRLIDKFTFERHLNFLGYIIKGLSWGIFNSFMKDSQFHKRHIFLPVEDPDAYKPAVGRKDIEEEWLAAIEVEALMSNLKSISRDLFLMHHFFGYSYVDLATLNHKKVKTIQKAVERARRKMREEYHREPSLPPPIIVQPAE